MGQDDMDILLVREDISAMKRIRSIDIPDFKEGKKVMVVRGKLKGQIFTVHQSANDWVMVKELDAQRCLFAKSSIQYAAKPKRCK